MPDESNDAGVPPAEATEPKKRAPRGARLRLRLVLDVVLTLAALGYVVHEARAVTDEDALPHIDRNPGPVRFGGLDLATRREIYELIVSQHEGRMAAGRSAFPTHVWSQYDHYANLMHQHMSQIAFSRHLSYTQVLLVYDEGVRKGWTSQSGAVIPGTWEPLHPRTE